MKMTIGRLKRCSTHRPSHSPSGGQSRQFMRPIGASGRIMAASRAQTWGWSPWLLRRPIGRVQAASSAFPSPWLLRKSFADKAPPLAKIRASRHLCGTLLRWRHLRLASVFTPRRCAMRSISAQLVRVSFVMGSDYRTNRPIRQAQFVQRRFTLFRAILRDG